MQAKNKIVDLYPCLNPVAALRNIADEIEAGNLIADEVTVIAGTEIFQLGGSMKIDLAAQAAIFAMTFGIHKLMRPATEYSWNGGDCA